MKSIMDNYIIQSIVTLYKTFILKDVESSEEDSEEEELMELCIERLSNRINSEKNVHLE